MLKISFTTSELDAIDKEVNFTQLQKEIIQDKRDELSNTQICLKHNISQSSLSREIKKIADKIKKIL